jgi:hypothetical protein
MSHIAFLEQPLPIELIELFGKFEDLLLQRSILSQAGLINWLVAQVFSYPNFCKLNDQVFGFICKLIEATTILTQGACTLIH